VFKKIKIEHFIIIGLVTLISGFSIFSGFFFLLGLELSNLYNWVILLLITVFIIGLLSKKVKIKFSGYLLLFFVFSVYLLINFILHDDFSEIPIKKFLLFLGNSILVTIITSTLKHRLFIFQSLVFFAVLNSIMFFGIYFILDMPNDLTWHINKGLGIDVIYFSRAIALGIVSLFLLKNVNLVVKIILTSLMFYCLFKINEVGPILGLIVVLFTYFFIKNSLLAATTMILAIISYFIIIIPLLPDLTIESMLQDPRIEIYLKNIEYFKNNPLFGIGWSGSYKIAGAYQSAHNIFFEILTEFGIFGFFQFIILIVILVIYFFKNINNEIAYIWLYSFIIVQVSGDISLNQIFWFSSILLVSNNFVSIKTKNSRTFNLK